MTLSCFADPTDVSCPVHPFSKPDLEHAVGDPVMKKWIEAIGFKASVGEFRLLPGSDGTLAGALFGLGALGEEQPLIAGALAKQLPERGYGGWKTPLPHRKP